MIATWLLVVTAQSGLQSAVEQVRAGDVVAAWRTAESVPDPLDRAQARVYVRQHAGDLDGALREAVQGSNAHPADPWLAERALAIALSLSRRQPAEEALSRLESVLRDPGARSREAFLAALPAARFEVEALRASARARDAAETRARIVVIGLGVSALLALVWLARRP